MTASAVGSPKGMDGTAPGTLLALPLMTNLETATYEAIDPDSKDAVQGAANHNHTHDDADCLRSSVEVHSAQPFY